MYGTAVPPLIMNLVSTSAVSVSVSPWDVQEEGPADHPVSSATAREHDVQEISNFCHFDITVTIMAVLHILFI